MKKLQLLLIQIVLLFVFSSCTQRNLEIDGGLLIEVSIQDGALNKNDAALAPLLKALQKRMDVASENNPKVFLDSSSQKIRVELPLENDSSYFHRLILEKGDFKIIQGYEFANKQDFIIQLKQYDSTFIELVTLYRYYSEQELWSGAKIGESKIKDTSLVNAMIDSLKTNSEFLKDVEFIWSYLSKNSEFDGQVVELYVIPKIAINSGFESAMFQELKLLIDDDPSNPHKQVQIDLKEEFKQKWANYTGENISKALPILLDGKVLSDPTVQSKIENGRFSIYCGKIEKEAIFIQALLSSGAINTKLKIEHLTRISSKKK